MKRYTLNCCDATFHVPTHADRTARRPYAACSGTLNADVEYQVWPNRAAMVATIRMQERWAEPGRYRWHACEALGPAEGY